MGWLGHGKRCFWPFKSDPECEECIEWDRIAQAAEVTAEAKYRAAKHARRKTTPPTESA